MTISTCLQKPAADTSGDANRNQRQHASAGYEGRETPLAPPDGEHCWADRPGTHTPGSGRFGVGPLLTLPAAAGLLEPDEPVAADSGGAGTPNPAKLADHKPRTAITRSGSDFRG